MAFQDALQYKWFCGECDTEFKKFQMWESPYFSKEREDRVPIRLKARDQTDEDKQMRPNGLDQVDEAKWMKPNV